MFKLSDFMTSINKQGVLKTNKYIVNFPICKYLNGDMYRYNTDDAKLVTLRCESAQLPGFSLASADGPPRFGYGPVQKHPYLSNFEDVSFTFIADTNSKVHQFFHDWLNVIVNTRSSGGKLMKQGSNSRWDPYEVGYKDSYSGDITIYVYDDTTKDQPSMLYTLYRAFPMGINSTPVSWNDSDVLKITIPFSYTDFSVRYPKVGSRLSLSAGAPASDYIPKETGREDAAAAQGPTTSQVVQNAVVEGAKSAAINAALGPIVGPLVNIFR